MNSDLMKLMIEKYGATHKSSLIRKQLQVRILSEGGKLKEAEKLAKEIARAT